ncbi:zinc ribbon domain-containing protein [bacterium 1XD8-76]|nr:zinc ribbon domain-containing protein [bacterium 1XD8-76]
MITCPKCHAQLEDGSRFCDSCGAPIPETPADPVQTPEPAVQQPEAETPSAAVYCPYCGQPTADASPFCPNCGKPLNGTDQHADHDQHGPQPQEDKEDKKQKKSKKGFIFAGIGVVLVAALVLVFILIGGNSGSSSRNYAMYVKDKEIYYTGFSRNDPLQVTSRLADSGDIDNYDFVSGSGELSAMCHLSEDGSLLFFPDRLSYSDDGYSLYWRKINTPKEEAVKIDSDVLTYSVSDDSSYITYRKNDTLYQYDRKKEDKQKIASDVGMYRVSADGKIILYMNTENVLYRAEKGADREKIDSDVSNLSYVSDDLSTILYIKDGTLYQKEGDGDKEKISSDVDNVLASYESGEIYYIKADTAEVPLSDYVYDDKKESDASLKEPEYPGWNATDAEYEAYESAYDEYNTKLQRDNFRQYLEQEKMELTTYTLCYYDGEEETTLSDSFSYNSYSRAVDNAVISYTAYDADDDIGVKLSELEDIYNVSNLVTEALYSASEVYVAVGGTVAPLDRETAGNLILSHDGSELYYFDEISENGDYGELYKVDISSSGELENIELYESDVYPGIIYFINDDSLLFFKDYKENKGELYIDQEKVDYDVYAYVIRYDEDTDKVTYFTDWNSEKGYGTLKIYSKKEGKKIADDVRDFSTLPNGDVLYLYDYSQKYYHGDLYLWDGKDAEKIDDSVICILPVY